MPKNPNESLSNNHALYVGVSGSGKTQALAQNVHLKNKSARVIYWDTHHSFKADHYNTIPELLKALKVAESKRGGYRIAYGGEKSPEAFDKLCRLVFAVIDGNKPHVFVVDELASITTAIAKDNSPLGDLLRESRKFGLVILLSATRAAEIPKTAFTNCPHKIIGAQGSVSDQKTMSDFLRIDHDLLADTELEDLNFWYKEPKKLAVKYRVKYKKPPL